MLFNSWITLLLYYCISAVMFQSKSILRDLGFYWRSIWELGFGGSQLCFNNQKWQITVCSDSLTFRCLEGKPPQSRVLQDAVALLSWRWCSYARQWYLHLLWGSPESDEELLLWSFHCTYFIAFTLGNCCPPGGAICTAQVRCVNVQAVGSRWCQKWA